MVTDKMAGTAASAASNMVQAWNPGSTQKSSPAAPFAGLVHSIMNQQQELGRQAQDAVAGLLSGQGVEVHDAVIATQKASAAFELALQVRNKAVSAYQQMMTMQF